MVLPPNKKYPQAAYQQPTWKDTDWQTILSPILDLGNKAHLASPYLPNG